MNNSDIDLIKIPIDLDQKIISFPFSELAEDITAIELELTEESVINPEDVRRVLLYNIYVIIISFDQLFLFGIDGKFIRTIGSKGQGPGEYNRISNVALDKKKNILYVNDRTKIVGYDLNEQGKKYLKEYTLINDNGFSVNNMNYINDELLIIGEKQKQNENGYYKHLAIYRLNEELQLIDSCNIRDDYFKEFIFVNQSFDIYLYNVDTITYLYYPEFFSKDINPAKKVLHDTLYRFENNQLIPEINIDIKNRKKWIADENFRLCHIYRSSRFVFVVYSHLKSAVYCYDMKTGTTYNALTFESSKGSYSYINGKMIENTDGGDQMKAIRPIVNNPELLYYLYTHTNPADLEEPNPTLYVVKLKK